MRDISIGSRTIGEGHPAFLVAEIGVNHQGRVDLAKALIDAAASAGADAVKFQKRSVDRMLTRLGQDAPYASPHAFGRTYGEHRRALEFSADDHAALKAHAEALGLVWFASAWDEESADVLEALGTDVYKIASPDLTNLPLLRHVARKGKPVILSTGMSAPEEIDRAVDAIREWTDDLVLLHCVSSYPTEYSEVNLGFLAALRERYGCPVGYSGHERGWAIPVAARALGACVIEKHVTLDHRMRGGDHRFSLNPQELRDMVDQVRKVEQALVDRPKRLLETERPFRAKLAKSVVAARPIHRGEVITRDMLACKSPGNGLSPLRIDEMVGKRVTRDISADEMLNHEDVVWQTAPMRAAAGA